MLVSEHAQPAADTQLMAQVMITMGEAIDATFGVTFGLTTLTAAGFGPVSYTHLTLPTILLV